MAIGQTLFEIVDPKQLEIQARVPSDLQSNLRLGSQVEYSIQGNPNRLTAVMSRISDRRSGQSPDRILCYTE